MKLYLKLLAVLIALLIVFYRLMIEVEDKAIASINNLNNIKIYHGVEASKHQNNLNNAGGARMYKLTSGQNELSNSIMY